MRRLKFQLGLTKTVDGGDVVIFEVGDLIFGKYRNTEAGSEWCPGRWNLNGAWIWEGAVPEIYIVPNVVPEIVNVDFVYRSGEYGPVALRDFLDRHEGKRIKICLEALE